MCIYWKKTCLNKIHVSIVKVRKQIHGASCIAEHMSDVLDKK